MKKNALITLFTTALIFFTGCQSQVPCPCEKKGVVKVAIIGGMTMTGLWQDISKMFEEQTGYSVEIVVTGPRDGLSENLREGKVDLLTMHSGDVTTNLVANGYGVNMQPWTMNELVIIGPSNDPAGIRGLNDGSEAFKRIAEKQANFVDFAGIGSREVCHNLWKKAGIRPQGDWLLKDESTNHKEAVNFAEQNNAYVVVGRMPVLYGKIPMNKMEIMVEDDPAMRRPYIVMETNPDMYPETNSEGAQCLSNFLLSSTVQNFLAQSPTNQQDNRPLFYPVVTR